MNRFLLAVLSILLAIPVYGQDYVFSSGFDDTAKGTLVSQADWTQLGSDATNAIQIVADPLDNTNQVVRLGGPNNAPTYSGQDVLGGFDPTSGVTATYVLGGNMETDFTLNLRKVQTGDYFFALAPTNTSVTNTFFAKIFAKSDGAGGYLLGVSATGDTPLYGSTSLDLNTAYSISLVWDFLGGRGKDLLMLSIDDTPELTDTWSENSAVPNQLSAFLFRQGGASTAPLALVDDLGIIYQAPEPTSLTLCVLSAALFFAQSRRSRPRK